MTLGKSVLLASAAFAAAPALAAPAATQALEQRFDALISPADQQQWLRQMSSEPNHVGSPHDKANTDMELALFKQWGWDAHIERFDVLYPTPISTIVELIAPEHVVLGGQEPPIAQDPSLTPANLAKALPPYVAYQGDGDVTAPVVYVDYGMPYDYDALAARGIDVRG
jgi:N-acetylated-alpha-linked acidic dipeptidase